MKELTELTHEEEIEVYKDIFRMQRDKVKKQQQQIDSLVFIIKTSLDFIGENTSLNDCELDELSEVLDSYREVIDNDNDN